MMNTKDKTGPKTGGQGNGQENRIVKTIQAWMVVRLSEELNVAPAEIDPGKPLLGYGLDSVIAFSLTGELADMLGRELPTTLFWDYPTLEALALHLADEIKDEQTAESLFAEIDRALSRIEELPAIEPLKSDQKQ